MLRTRELDVTVGSRALVRGLDFTASRGSITCLLGRNGAGKTLTLHTLCGLRSATRGDVFIDDRPLADWPRRDLARQLGLLAQNTEDPFPSTVMETVLIGRHPHIDFWQWESDTDRSIASDALRAVDLEGFDSRDIGTLSGGERRRAAIATLLAQNPALFVLDEPINHLDPHHQLDALALFRARANEGRTVIMSLHDAGLAARFCDQAVLLFGDGDWLCGPTREVLTEATMARLYGVAFREVTWEGGRTFVTM